MHEIAAGSSVKVISREYFAYKSGHFFFAC